MRIDYAEFIDRNNIIVDIENRTIGVKQGGYIDEDGVSVAALYSYFKELWKEDRELIKYKFPLESIDRDNFINTGEWHIKPNNIKDGMIYPNYESYQYYLDGEFEKFKREFAKDIRKKKLKQLRKNVE